jgi:hypothetical protein
MPLKFTWKSIVGLAVSLGGVATQAYQSNATSSPHPTSAYNAVLVVAGAVIIGAERIADAWDNKTSLTAKIAGVVDTVKTEAPAVTKVVQEVSPELKQLRAEAQAAVAHAQELVDRANAAGAATSHSVA